MGLKFNLSFGGAESVPGASSAPTAPATPRDMFSPGQLGIDAGAAYELAMSGGGLPGGGRPAPNNPSRPLLDGIRIGMETYRLRKAVENNYWKSVERAQRAALQGTVVNPALDFWGLYDSNGVREKTGTTFHLCRRMAQDCEVLAAIIGKRVEQVAAFSRRAVVRRGQVNEPGFRVKLSDPKAKATPEDEARIAELEQYILECGYCEPPEEEKPVGWQPGFDMFLRALVRDSLTLDHVAVRRWKSARDPERYPVVSFACVDAARVRKRAKELVRIDERGVKVEREWEHERTWSSAEQRFAWVDEGGMPLQFFTKGEMFTAHRRPRTDEYANGYGFAEIEEAFTSCTLWCGARDFNGLRMSKNVLPRGFFTVFGNISDQQMQAFQMHWKQQMQGLRNSQNVPMVKGLPQQGSQVLWNPIDMSPKDMEHGQSMFTYGLWMHILFQIHPEETGFSAASPFRPPLSEASPETNLKYSQDTGLRPLLRWVENQINREIIWRVDPSRRYSFEFMGVGDYDELQDVQVRVSRLQGGLSTPEQEWDELDVVMPDEIRNHPAARFPAPFAVGYQMLEASMQQEYQRQQGEQQMQSDQQQQAFGQDMEKFRAAKEGYEQEAAMQPDVPGGQPGRPGETPVGTPAGVENPATPILKSVGWPFV